MCARCQGGNNAGHTIVVDGTSYDFHMLPSGLINPRCLNLIGSGVVVHISSFFKEMNTLIGKGLGNVKDRVFLSDRAHLVFDFHQMIDGAEESALGALELGTTKKGIGPTYASKAARSGIRVHHLFHPEEFKSRFVALVKTTQMRYPDLEIDVEAELKRYAEYAVQLAPFVVDAVEFMSSALANNKKVLVEGANALMLDLDFGTYPFVTSSNTSIGGVCTGLAIPPARISTVVGVVKAYTSRVGAGPFPTELLDADGERLQSIGKEFGVTTGRKRRCGWLDLVAVKYSHAINGYTQLNLTKLDVLDDFEEIKVGVGYVVGEGDDEHMLHTFPADLSILQSARVKYHVLPGWKSKTTGVSTFNDLPPAAKSYVDFIERFVKVRIGWVGVGPSRASMLRR